jgi:hypothetical protein
MFSHNASLIKESGHPRYDDDDDDDNKPVWPTRATGALVMGRKHPWCVNIRRDDDDDDDDNEY